ncbi:MAG: immunoglobulin-like domain-containing protein [Christensenellales bacterium]
MATRSTWHRMSYIPDTTAPVISGAKHTVYIGGSVDYLKGVTVTDDTDGDITDKIAVNSDAVNTAKAGTYSVTYTYPITPEMKQQKL